MKRKAHNDNQSPRNPKKSKLQETEKKLIVVLEEAYLETVYIKERYELLNCDDHRGILKKHKKDFADARPDITHQCLLNLLDSPLNKAGLLQVYIQTQKNVLIKVNPQTRIPRTFSRFCGLMVQLLHEFKISSVSDEGSMTLLKVIKNPVTSHLPMNCKKVGTSCRAALTPLDDWVKAAKVDGPIVFVIGAMSRGSIRSDYTTEKISFSQYPLSGALACAKICTAFEKEWGIV